MSFRGLTGWLLALLLAATTARAASTLDKIDKAQAEGRLSADRAILLKVQTLKGAKNMPAEFQPDEPIPERCGTRVTSEAIENWDSYSPSIQAALRQALARPVQQKSYTSPDGIFLIHYDTVGLDSVPLADLNASGVPDYVENLALYADSSYRMEVLQLSYRLPPFDADSLYDIYTQEIEYYGYTEYEGPGSFIVVHNNFFNFPPNNDPDGYQKGAMKVTIAHEFHHAIQFAYSASFSNHIWFMEITSTWMEDVVFDPVDDNYNYLPYFFNFEPYLPLTNTGIHMYASFIWNQYLAQNFGRDIIRQVWEQNITTNSVQSLNLILQASGSNLGSEFSRFALWNFHTGSRDDGQHYEEGNNYPDMFLTPHSSFNDSGRSRSILPLAALYEAFPSAATIEKARLTFTGRPVGIWNARIILNKPSAIRVYPFNLVNSNTGDTVFFGLDSFPQVVLIAAQIKTGQLSSPEYFDYTYKAFPFYIQGDLNEDLVVNPVDIVFQIDLVFLEIPPPENRLEAADLNCDGALTPADLVFLLNLIYLFQPPSCP